MRALLVSIAFVLLFAGSAKGAGVPLPTPQSGAAGVVAPGGDERLTTRIAGGDTLVRAVRRSDGKVVRSARIAGRWSISPVTLDGGTTGLSADGSTLVLARPTRRYPPVHSPLAVVDARSLRISRVIDLAGFSIVDAVSPDGRWAYLVQYAGNDPFDYRVRALDTRTGQLDPHDVIDPREPDERMGGIPFNRVTSGDGRWVYTLYGGGAETFIHALDTVGRSARCIDLEMLPSQSDLSHVRMRLAGDRLLVRDRGGTVARVNRRTFAVNGEDERAEPAATAAAAPARHDDKGGGGPPWAAFALGAVGACVCAAAAVAVARRPRRA